MAALLTVAGACREGERVEFAEAKDRLKSSWAVDRDDFARVKEQLKKKNAEHHVQNGRLSQSLKVGTSIFSTASCLIKSSCSRRMSRVALKCMDTDMCCLCMSVLGCLIELCSPGAGVGGELQNAAGAVPAQRGAGASGAHAEQQQPCQLCLHAGEVGQP